MPMIMQAGEDDGWLSSLLPWNDEELADAPIAVGTAEQRNDVHPTDADAYFAIDTGAVYQPSDDYSDWTKLESTGRDPHFRNASAESMDAGVVSTEKLVTACFSFYAAKFNQPSSGFSRFPTNGLR